MAQETEIRVRIDDNEALSKLREILDVVQQIDGGLQGFNVPAGAIPAPSSAPAPTPEAAEDAEERAARRQARREREQRRERARRIEGIAEIGGLVRGGGFTAGGGIADVGGNLTDIAKTLPFGLGVPVAGAGEYLKLMGRSLQERQQLSGAVAQLEQQETALQGVVDVRDPRAFIQTGASTLNPLGFGMGETAQLLTNVVASAGFKTAQKELTGSLDRLGVAERTGIPAALLGNLAGAIAQSTGVTVGQALEQSLVLRNVAEQSLDLRGAGVQGFLQSFGALVDQFTQRGIKIDPQNLARQITGIAAATGTRGERPAQILSGLLGFAEGAGGEITGALQGFAQQAIVAEAAAESTDLFSFLSRLEQQQTNALGIARTVSQAGGGGRTGAALLSAIPNIGTRDARGLLGARLGTLPTRDRLQSADLNLALSGTIAQTQDKTTQLVQSDVALAQRLIEVSAEMQQGLIKLSENEETVLKITDLQQGIQEKILDIAGKVQDGLNILKRYF